MLAGILLGISALSLAVVWFYKNSESVPARGGRMTVGLIGQPATINPVLASSEADRTLVAALFSPVSKMAEKVESEPEQQGRAWRLRLQDGWTWNDKKRVISDDIIFTINKIREAGAQSPSFAIWKTVRAERVSERELVFLLPAPYAHFPKLLEGLYPTPQHVFKDLPVANWHLSQHMLQPVGNGPFVISSAIQKKDGYVVEIETDAVPNHPEHPYLANLRFSFFVDNKEALAALNNGTIGGFFSLEPIAKESVLRPFETNTVKTRGLYGIYLNSSKNALLSDVRVRQALSALLNREIIARLALGDNAQPAYSISPNPSTENQSSSNENRADELLRAAGWQKEEDIWVKKTTTPAKNKSAKPTIQSQNLTFSLTTPNVPFLQRAAEEIIREWQEAGIQVTLNEGAVDSLTQEEVRNRTFESLLWGQIFDASGDLFPFWHSSQRFAPGMNLTLLSDPQLDSALEQYRENLDPDKAAAAYQKAENISQKSYLFLPLFIPRFSFLHTGDLRGITIETANEPADFLASAANWYVHTTRKLK